MDKTAIAIAPRWLTLAAAAAYSGLNARTIQLHIARGLIRSSHVKAPEASRGRRLVDRLSLDEFIEAGVSVPPAVLAMNQNHRQPPRSAI